MQADGYTLDDKRDKIGTPGDFQDLNDARRRWSESKQRGTGVPPVAVAAGVPAARGGKGAAQAEKGPVPAPATLFDGDGQRDRGEHLHARYVLTEKGGMRFDSGLDPGTEGETTDVSLLDRGLHQQRWADYQPPTSPFELVAETSLPGRGQ